MTVVSYAYAVWVYVGCVNNKSVDIRHFGDDRYNSIMHAYKKITIPIKTSRCIRTCNTCMTLPVRLGLLLSRVDKKSSPVVQPPQFRCFTHPVNMMSAMRRYSPCDLICSASDSLGNCPIAAVQD